MDKSTDRPIQFEFEREKEVSKIVTVYCECLKTSPRTIIMQPSLSPAYLVGECSNCHKIHTLRRDTV